MMDPNCKPIHACAYTVPRSVEQHLRKEIVRLVDIGVLEEDYSSEWASPSFAIPKKNGTIRVVTDFRKSRSQFIVETSPISYSKDWGHDPFNGRDSFIPMVDGKYNYKGLPIGIMIASYVFKTSCLILSKLWDLLRLTCYLDDLLILTNSSFKNHLLKLEIRNDSSKTLNRWYESEHLQI
jgi:hypothetical protein